MRRRVENEAMERISITPKVSCEIHIVKLVPPLLPDLINTLVLGNNIGEVANNKSLVGYTK